MIESKRNSQKGVCIFMGRHRRERGIFRELLGWLLYILIIIGLTYVIITYVGQRTRVSGQSMETTLSDGDNLIVDKLTYHFKDPERFDIIVFPYKYEETLTILRGSSACRARRSRSSAAMYISTDSS